MIRRTPLLPCQPGYQPAEPDDTTDDILNECKQLPPDQKVPMFDGLHRYYCENWIDPATAPPAQP